MNAHRHYAGASLWLKMAFMSAIFYISSPSFPTTPVANAKEIVATKEWQKLQEGDTLPKGLHVRMDLETGDKWAKLLEEEDTGGNDQSKNSASSSLVITDNGNVEEARDTSKGEKAQSATTLYENTVKITQLANAELSADASAKITSQLLQQSQREANLKKSIAALNDFKNDKSAGETDYEMMYRTLASLPAEGLVSMGMKLPLPIQKDATDKEKVVFEAQVRVIWSARQELLKKMEEEYLADVSDLIFERIQSLTDYLGNPMQSVRDILNIKINGEESDLSTITGVLEDLEFQLTDLDNARDFHNMGGWPLLVAFLTDAVHGLDYEIEQIVALQTQTLDLEQLNGTNSLSIQLSDDDMIFLQEYQKVVWKIQGLACWCMGTAVKNVEEFHPWAVEDFSELMTLNADGDIVNVITILLNKLHAESTRGPSILDMPLNDGKLQLRRKYELYALGSLLRGNRDAIHYFGAVHGPSALFELHQYLTEEQNIKSMDKVTLKLLEKVIILADDIVMDVKLHPSDRPENDALLVEAFTTEEWCTVPVTMFYHGSVNIQMRMLGILLNMSHSCEYQNRPTIVAEMNDHLAKNEDLQALMSKFELIVNES